MREIAAHGHEVLVEAGAGEGIGAFDADYAEAGATIVPNAAEVFGKADLVGAPEVDSLIHRLKHMNPRAPMQKVHFGEVPLAQV